MSAHTQGPWRLHDVERATIVAGKPGGEVANCCNGFGDQDANARFIVRACNLVIVGQAITDAHSAKIKAQGDIPADPNWGLTENEVAAACMMNALMVERDDLLAALKLARAYLDVSLGSPSWTGENPYPVMDAAISRAEGRT